MNEIDLERTQTDPEKLKVLAERADEIEARYGSSVTSIDPKNIVQNSKIANLIVVVGCFEARFEVR